MNIAIVTAFHEGTGGVETINRQLTMLFESEGHSVDIYSVDRNPGIRLNPLLSFLIGKPYVTSVFYNASKKKYDITICNGEYGYGINSPKSIVVFHMSYLGYRESLKKGLPLRNYLGLIRGIFLQKLGSKGKFVVAVSEFLKGNLGKQGIKTDIVIPNAVDTVFFHPDPASLRNGRGLFVGRYDPYAKGFDILERIAAKGIPLDCVTQERPYGRLNWLGRLDYSELPGVYNRYQYLVFPSRYESFGIVPIEAMACGLPVVISNVGMAWELKRAIPEFVVDGWGDDAVDNYVGRIKTILADWVLFSKKARDFTVRNYSIDIFQKKWLDLIYKISGKRSHIG